MCVCVSYHEYQGSLGGVRCVNSYFQVREEGGGVYQSGIP